MGIRKRLFDSYLKVPVTLAQDYDKYILFQMLGDHLDSLDWSKRNWDPELSLLRKICYGEPMFVPRSEHEVPWDSIYQVIEYFIRYEKHNPVHYSVEREFWLWMTPYIEEGSVVRYITENGEGYGFWFTENGMVPIRGELTWTGNPNPEDPWGYSRDITSKLPDRTNLDYVT
jgi:hypothetical protein